MEDNNSNQLNQDPQGVVLDANDAVQKHEVINPFVTPSSYSHKSKNLTLWTTIAAILVLIFIALVGYILVKSQKSTLTTDNKPNTSKQDLSVVGLDQLNLGQLGQLDVNGIIKVNNGIVLKPATQPESPLLGQIYLNNTTKQLAYYDGEVFQTLATPTNSVSSIGGVSGAISLGAGLTLQGNTLSAEVINNTSNSAGVTSVQGQSGAVLLVGGPGITVSGTKISNAGVTKLGGRTGSISAGRGISLSGNTLLSTVSLSSASATLVVTDDGNGNYTISQIGSGSSGSVALGPAVAQTDASNFPSISVDKTGMGNLIEFSVGGVNRFVVGQGGAITTGAIGFSQITGLPQIVNNFTDGSSNTATGAITLGSGLALSGNTIINTATGGITAVNGTANQVNSSTSLGVVTLSLPQDINTNSTPQFSGITLTGLGNGIVQSSSGVLSGGSVDRNSGTLFTNQLSVANGGTGSNSASGARTNLGAAASGANSDITSLSGLTTALSVGQGGTGSTSLSQNGVLIGNGSGAISSVVAGGSGLCLTSTAGAPAWAACPGSGGVSSVNTFTGAVVIQGTTNQVTVSNNTGTITLSLPQDINTTSSPQFSSMTLTSTLAVQGASATIGGVAQGGSLILNDGSTNTATILSAALGQNVVYTLPDPGQATATICLSTGNCAGAGAGVTTGGGTSGRIPVFTAAQNIEDSTLSQSGSIITASGSVVVQGALGVTLGTNNSVDGIATFNNDSGTHTVSLQAPNADPASNLVFRLPSADGASGNCLKTDSFGVLSFGSCLSGAGGGSGGVISLNGLSGNLSLANASGSGSTVTIDDATTLAKGIASFSSSFFTVSSGAVSLATGSVTSNEIANATITGTDIANSTVANTNLVNSSLSVNAGTGLSGGGSVALGASTSLSVSYGGSSGTAVEGNTILTCPSGAGNLTGGGTSITLGNGGTCADLNTVANPTFLTSVTTAEYIFTGAGNNGSLKIGNLGQVTTYTLPDPGGASATICLNTGNCAGSGGGVTTAGGTTNAIAKFTGSQTLGDSSISDNGTTVTVGVNLNVSGAVTLSNELTVGNGGTGATTFTSNGILYGNGTGALQATAAGATGECLIGNTGAAPSWGSCAGAAGGVSSLNTFTGGVTVQGTANQVVVSNNTGTITLSLPQSINTSSSPQFTNLTLSGNLTVQGGTGTFGTTTQAGSLVVYDGTSNTGTIQTAALGQNTSYTLPDPGGASATICLSTGNCAGAGSGVTTPGGATNAIPKFTGSQTLGDSSISDNGSVVTTSGDLAVNGGDITSTAGTLTINAGGAVDIQDGVTVDSLTADTGNVNIASGVLQTAGTTRITNSGVLQNVTNADASTFFTGGSLTVARGGTGAGTFTANGVIYGNGTSALGVTAAGTTGQCLIATTGSAPTWGTCAGAGSGSTLQAAYDNGNTITTSDARNINFTLANSTTDSNFVVQVADDSTGYASISRVDGAGTNDPAQLLLIDNLDTNRAVTVGLRLQAAAGGLTVGIDVSDNEIVTGLALGTNDVTVNGVTVAAAEFALLDGRDGALVDTNDAVATAITGTGALNAGSITSGFGTIDNADTITGTTLNGTTGINSGAGAGTQRIDASGNLVNIGDAAINGGDITSTAATLVINAGGNVDIQDAATVDSLTADSGNVAITSGALTTAGTTRLTNGGALQNITGFSQTSGTFATSGITSFSVDGTAAATYALGASATSGTIAIGGAAQTGTITLGQSTDTNTINIGNASTAAGKTQTINIGTGGSGTSTTSISIGSTTGGTTYLYGNTYLANLNSANNANYLCQNSFGYLASCNTTGTGAAFVQGGNSFGATATLGTNDSNSLTFETNNATQATIAVGGGTTFKNSADSNTAFRIQNTSSNNFLLVDTLGSSISIGNTGIASTIQIGNTTGAVVQTINVGNNGTASSSSNVVIGSTIGGTTTLQSQAGTIISTLGAADNTNYLCRNTSNIIATCNAASITLQGAYDGDADGSDSIITLSTADDGIIIRNPAASGSDSTYNLTLDQLSTGAKGGLSIQSAGTGNLLLVTDTTATARDVLTIADTGITTFRNQTDSTDAFMIQNAAATNTVFTVDTTNGRVGINDTNPSHAFDVTGQIRSTTATGAAALTINCTGTCANAQVAGNWDSSGYWGLGVTGTTNDNTLQFGNVSNLDTGAWSGTQNLNLILGSAASGGGIGIGTGAAPTARLQITSSANDTLLKITDSTATSADVLTIADKGWTTFRNQTDDTTSFEIQNAAGTSNLFVADTTNSRIGIQTASPDRMLTIAPPSNAAATLGLKSTGGAGGSIEFSANGTYGAAIGYNKNADGMLEFTTGGIGFYTGDTVFSLSSTGQATFTNGTNSTTAFQVQNAAAASLLNVDSTYGGNLTVLGNNSAEVGVWATNSNSITARRTGGSVVANGYVYYIGGYTGAGSTGESATVQYAKINANGSLGIFNTTTSLNTAAALISNSVVYANGYIYVVGGDTGSYATTVQYAPVNPDGTLGTWQTTSSLPAARASGGAIVRNGYVYYIGGFSSGTTAANNVYYAKLNADGTIGTWQTNGSNQISAVGDDAVVTANGYIYVVGGYNSGSGGSQTSVQSAAVNNDGSTGTWGTTTTIPARDSGGAVLVNGYIYFIGGNSGGSDLDDVYYAAVGTNGNVGSWTNATNQVPVNREYAGVVTANGYIYSVGGAAAGAATSGVYYTNTPRLTLGGSLDLVGLSGESLNENSSGGSLTAGNTNVIGTLNVQGASTHNGNLSVNGDATFKAGTNSTSSFTIQNASGASLLNSDTTNLDITVGGNLLVSKASQANQDWTKVSGTAGTIGGNATTAIDRAYSSAVYNGSLYIGTNKTGAAEIYRYDGSNVWTKVSPATAGTIGTAGTPTPAIDEIRSMVVYNGSLYAGTAKSNSAEVYRYDGGTTWTKVTQTTAGTIAASGTASIDKASRMVVYNGSLYMGTDENNSAEIYRYDGGTNWTRVSFDATHIQTGSTATIDAINGFAILNNQLFVAAGDGSNTAGTGAEIYRYDGGSTWTSITPAVGSFGTGVTNVNFVYGITAYNGSLYVGTNDTAANVAEIVRYDGGVGASAVWTKVSQSSAGTIASGGTSNVDGIAKLIVYNGKMYASTFSSNIGEVYRYDGGTTWVKISQTTAGTIAAGGTANIDSVYNLEVYNGSLYAGTGETGAAEVYRYSDNIIEGRSSDTAGVFNLGASGTVNFQNSTNSTTAFNIQNTVGDNLFTVDSTNAGNITLLGNNGAAVGAWTTNSNNLTSGTLNAGITYANGYVYVVGGNSSGISTKVEYAKVNANGSIGTFATTTSLPTARDDLQAIVSNGYIYALGGTTSGAAGGAVTTVNYAKLNADGTVGNWGTTSSLPSGRYTSSAVVYNGYIYMVAGSDTSTAIGTTAYAKINADGSLGAWTVSGNAFPSGNVRRAPSVVVANGYLYSMAGQSGSGAGSGKSDVYYSRIASDGSIGAWSTATSMPGGRSWGGAAVSNGYIYYYGGYDGSADQEEVYYAQLNSDGSLGSWNTNATGMNTSEADFGWFSTNGYIYALGIGTSNAQVQYTSTARVSIGGNLDLVGISGENLAEGGSGGSLTAGNTSIIGTLNVQDQANFQQSLDVGGTLTVHGGIYSGQDIKIDRRTNSGGTSSDWVVTNSTAGTIGSQTLINSVESMAVYNGSLYIGTYDSSGNSAEVYRYDENDGTYTLVSSSGFGNSVERIQSMLVYNGYLYAGTQKTNGAQIFRYDGGTTWTNVSGTAGTIGGNDTNVDGVYGMAVWHGKMYIGTFASGGVGEVYRYDGGSIWADLIGTAGNICGTGGNDYVHELEVFQDQLYAATFGGADICRYNGGTSWTRVNAASGQIATGGTSGIQGVESMAVFNGALYAGTYNDDGLGAGHAEIYRYDGGNAGEWVKVSNTTAGTIASGGTSSIDIVATLMPYNGKLYAGTWGSSGSNPDKAEVYVFDPVANSWSKVSYTTAGKITSSGTANINGVIQMQVYNDKLYAATGEANSSEIYKFSAVYDQSYSLRFSAASSTVTGTEQGSYFNEGSIYFSAGLQGTNTNDYSQTGSFVFSHGITTATGSYDVAEDYPTRDGLLSTGDVVTIDPDETGFVKRSDEKMQSTIVGVYSEKPALRLGQKDTTINGGIAIPVALAGRVPVKVSLENGPIKPGDFLTSSSTPGYAMKATEAGPSLGKALGSFDGTNGSEGKVLAFVNVSYYAPPTGSTLQANQTMDGNLYVQGSGTFAGDLNVGGKATIGSLKVSGDSTFEGDVAVIGSLTTQTLTVEGHIITGGEVPTIDVLQTGIQASDITVVGNDTSGTISINVPAAEILTEGDLVKLIFAKAYNKTPKVVISPIGVNSAKLGAYVDQKQTEFVLGVSTPPPTDASYKFNYFIVE